MEGGGRNEILNWLNDTLQLKYTKIEHTATGAAHCQLMDVLFPGKLPLSKVNFNAKYDYEFTKNFNLLQETFIKLGIDKYQGAMDVDRMVTGRPQANLDFCQWMKKFFELHYNGEPYNALERRVMARVNYEGDKALLAALGPNAPKAPPKPTTATSTSSISKTAAKPVASVSKPVSKPTATASTTLKPKPAASTTTASAGTTTATKPTTTKPAVFKPTPSTKPATVSAASTPAAPQQTQQIHTTVVETIKIVDPNLVKELEESRAEVEKLTTEVTNLKITIEDIEKDRDFFYNKLRDVEVYCQANDNSEITSADLIKHILSVLYQTDDQAADGEQQPEGEEETIPQEDEEEQILEEEEEIPAEEEEILEEEAVVDDENLDYGDETLAEEEEF